MRNIYILVCLLIFSLNFLEAQNGALAKYNTTGAYVYLRWSPTTFKELRSSVDSGYTIVRYLTHVSGLHL